MSRRWISVVGFVLHPKGRGTPTPKCFETSRITTTQKPIHNRIIWHDDLIRARPHGTPPTSPSPMQGEEPHRAKVFTHTISLAIFQLYSRVFCNVCLTDSNQALPPPLWGLCRGRGYAFYWGPFYSYSFIHCKTDACATLYEDCLPNNTNDKLYLHWSRHHAAYKNYPADVSSSLAVNNLAETGCGKWSDIWQTGTHIRYTHE